MDIMYSLALRLDASLIASVCCTQYKLAQKRVLTAKTIKEEDRTVQEKQKIKGKMKLHESHPLDTSMANTNFVRGTWPVCKRGADSRVEGI